MSSPINKPTELDDLILAKVAEYQPCEAHRLFGQIAASTQWSYDQVSAVFKRLQREHRLSVYEGDARETIVHLPPPAPATVDPTAPSPINTAKQYTVLEATELFADASQVLASALNDQVAIDSQYFLEGVTDALLGRGDDTEGHGGVSECRDYSAGYRSAIGYQFDQSNA